MNIKVFKRVFEQRVKTKEEFNMAVHPFYVEVNSSSRANTVGVGCKQKSGYVETYIYQRDEGNITTPFKVIQRSVEEEGKLKLYTEVYYRGELIKTHITNY